MNYCVYTFGAVLILYALGLGFTIWILPNNLQRYAAILAPVIGYSYCVIGCWHLYNLGAKIDQGPMILLLVPPGISLLLAFFWKREALWEAFSFRPALAALLIASAAFLALSIPVLREIHGLTTVSLFGYDAPQYAAIARFFAEFGKGATGGAVGQRLHSFEVAAQYGYFGAFVFPAALGGFLGLMPHQLISLATNLFACLAAAATFLILYDTLGAPIFPSHVAVGLVGFHPILFYVAAQVFLAQALAMPLALALVWVNSKAVLDRRWEQQLRYALLCSLLIGGLLLTYQHMLPFLFFFIGVFVAVLAVAKKDLRILLSALTLNTLACFGALVLCPSRLDAVTAMLRATATNEAGWPIPWIGPEYLTAMVVQIAPMTMPPVDHLLLVAAAILLLGWIFLGFRFSPANSERVSFAFATIAIYVGCIVLVACGETFGIRSNYKSFKLASFFLPCFMAVIACSFGIRRTRWRRWFVVCDLVLLFAFATACFFGDRAILRVAAIRNLRVEPAYADLLQIDRDPEVPSVNVLGDNGWKLMWDLYFLMHKQIYLEGTSSYYPASPLLGAYDLEDITSCKPPERPLARPMGPIRKINERFTLVGPLAKAEAFHLDAPPEIPTDAVSAIR
ncbi:MAG: hypothetical protein ABI992_05170 [Chthoniobacterales bacterium]